MHNTLYNLCWSRKTSGNISTGSIHLIGQRNIRRQYQVQQSPPNVFPLTITQRSRPAWLILRGSLPHAHQIHLPESTYEKSLIGSKWYEVIHQQIKKKDPQGRHRGHPRGWPNYQTRRHIRHFTLRHLYRTKKHHQTISTVPPVRPNMFPPKIRLRSVSNL